MSGDTTDSLPPPRGEVRRRILAASGWGKLGRAPALLLERDAPTPASRFARRRTSPQGGGMSRGLR